MRYQNYFLAAALLATSFATQAQSLSVNKMYGDSTTKAKPFTPLTLCNTYGGTYNPLTPASFSRMMQNDYTYALLGTKSPVSGFKIETSTPSLTLSGNIYSNNSRSFLLSMQVSASTQNSLSQLFSNQKLNGTFSGSFGFNFLLSNAEKGIYNIKENDKKLKHFVINDYAMKVSRQMDTTIIYAIISQESFQQIGSFDEFVAAAKALESQYAAAQSICPAPGSMETLARGIFNKYGHFELSQNPMYAAFADARKNQTLDNTTDLQQRIAAADGYGVDFQADAKRLIQKLDGCCGTAAIAAFDTALVYNALGSRNPNNLVNFDSLFNRVNTLVTYYAAVGALPPPDGDQITGMIKAVLKKYQKFPVNDTALFKSFREALNQGRLENNAALDKKLSEARAYAQDIHKNAVTIQNKVNDSCIAIFKDIWVKKRLLWISLNPSVSNSSVTFYNVNQLKTSDTNALVYGLQASLNLLTKYKQSYRFAYAKLAVDLGQSNNIADLAKITYLNSTTLTSTSTSALTSQKTGTAYKGALDNGFGWDIFLEYYSTFWKEPGIPGLYVKPLYSYAATAINQHKLSLDLGIIWNLNSSDKTKNIVSIVPYVNWSNLLTNYTDQTRTTKSTLAQLFSAGLKFGIPINLGN